jgi:hypothetical protein
MSSPEALDGKAAVVDSEAVGAGDGVRQRDANGPPVQTTESPNEPIVMMPLDVEDAATTDGTPQRVYLTGWRLYVLTFAFVILHSIHLPYLLMTY